MGPFTFERRIKRRRRQAAAKIAALNAGWTAEQKRLNNEEEVGGMETVKREGVREAKAASKLKGEKCEKTTQISEETSTSWSLS